MPLFPPPHSSLDKVYQVKVPFHCCYQPDFNPHGVFTNDEVSCVLRQGTVTAYARVKNGKYEIIYGWHQLALKHSGDDSALIELTVVPYTNQEAVRLSVLYYGEHIKAHRMYIARALKQAKDAFNVNDEWLSTACEKRYSRSTITNLLRLNKLDPEVQTIFIAGGINNSSAKLLASFDPAMQRAFAKDANEKGWTSEDLRARILKDSKPTQTIGSGLDMLAADPLSPHPAPNQPKKDLDTIRLENELTYQTGAPTEIFKTDIRSGYLLLRTYSAAEIISIGERLAKHSGNARLNAGIKISFTDYTEFDAILAQLGAIKD
ncbi:MAG: hypothetical protein V3T17_02890 [Pseudomonadales bacterium]